MNSILKLAVFLLWFGLLMGLVGALVYLIPNWKWDFFSMDKIRPLHVSAMIFWILSGAMIVVLRGLSLVSGELNRIRLMRGLKWTWISGIICVFLALASGFFGGREYWEFPFVFSVIIAFSWIFFLWQVIYHLRRIRVWPVYVWMWMTGAFFFMFEFVENYLWLIPYFRNHLVLDMTVQWKVNGSIVGAWNQMIYGTAFFIIERISKDKSYALSRTAYVMYFLGMFNLMFNWGHHVYTMPTLPWVKWVGYAVSMTEWVFFFRIIWQWKSTLDEMSKHEHIYAYKFIMASEFWVFLNMLQAVLMSIPAINVFTHGTHFTVAHAMGTTIGINTMILLAAFHCLFRREDGTKVGASATYSFWIVQISLFVFWLAFVLMGLSKALWYMAGTNETHSAWMDSVLWLMYVVFMAGLGMAIGLIIITRKILRT